MRRLSATVLGLLVMLGTGALVVVPSASAEGQGASVEVDARCSDQGSYISCIEYRYVERYTGSEEGKYHAMANNRVCYSTIYPTHPEDNQILCQRIHVQLHQNMAGERQVHGYHITGWSEDGVKGERCEFETDYHEANGEVQYDAGEETCSPI